MSEQSSPVLTPSPVPAGDAPSTDRPKSKLRWAMHLTIMAALPVIAGLGGAATSRQGPALTGSARGLLIVSVYEVLFFAVFLGLAWLFSRASKDDLLLRWRPGFWVLPLGVVYSVAIRLIAIIVVVTSLAIVFASHAGDAQKYAEEHRPKVEALVDMQALTHDPVYFWLSVIVVSLVVGGLREELWRSSFLAGLRALWPRVFDSPGGGIGGAAVAAMFFGAGHFPQGVLAVGLVTVVGFLLGVIMSLHRSIWPSVVAHGLFDATTMIMLAWMAQNVPTFQRMMSGQGG
jgi:hypothetical protein